MQRAYTATPAPEEGKHKSNTRGSKILVQAVLQTILGEEGAPFPHWQRACLWKHYPTFQIPRDLQKENTRMFAISSARICWNFSGVSESPPASPHSPVQQSRW